MTEGEAFSELRSEDPRQAAEAEAILWALWHRSGDRELDALLRQGLAAMEGRRFEEAEQIFTRIIQRAPDFAEGWNKRATVRYLREDYGGSIADCGETLARNPNHFGALSGQGLCHLGLAQYREAATMFRRALAVHPHLTGARQNLAQALAEAVKGNGH